MLTVLYGLIDRSHRERGQVLVLSVFFLLLVLIVAALVVDSGFFLRARRDSQNSADAAALAGAQHLPDDPIGAEDAALQWASQNGWTDGVDGVTVTVTTPYNADPKKIEVVVAGGARGVGFFDALMNVSSRAVAEVVITDTGPGGGGPGGGGTPMAKAPTEGCDGSDNAFVDGRVTSGEGYEKFADLIGEFGTIFGEAFLACDSGYYYFALQLNGPDAAADGGGVANENVYTCKAGNPKKKPKLGDCGPDGNPNYHVDYETGWETSEKGTHTFKDLLNSDRSRFQIACGSTPVHDFVQDYLRLVGSSWVSDAAGNGQVDPDGVGSLGPTDSASSLEFNLENTDITHWGDEAGEDPLTQSPPFSPTYPNYSGDYDGWVWEMLYEFRVPISAYDGCPGVYFGLPPVDGGAGPVGGMHSSPAKVDEGVFVGVSTMEILLVE